MLSRRVLSPSTPSSVRILFIWHAFDFLIHSIFEGSFLYNCFFTSSPFDPSLHHPALITNFLGQPDRLYGAAYGDNWATKLWMVYAQADRRWGGADLTVVSLELLTVLVAGPLALWICTMIVRKDPMASFWMVVLATGELYGGLLFFPLFISFPLLSSPPLLLSLPLPSSFPFIKTVRRYTYDARNRIHDLRPRMADRKPKSRRQ